MKKLILSAIIIFAATTTLLAQNGSTKTEKIKRMLELSGASKMAMQAIDQMIAAYKTQQPSLSNQFWDDFKKELNVDDLNNLIIPIYDKHYTEEDLDGIIAFYQSDLGKRMLEKTPLVMQESMQAGQIWGKQIGEKIIKKIQEENQND